VTAMVNRPGPRWDTVDVPATVNVVCVGCGIQPDPLLFITYAHSPVPVFDEATQTTQAILQGWYVTDELTLCAVCSYTSVCDGLECETPCGGCPDCLTVLCGGELKRNGYTIRRATQ
jgi:hypothetical protein